MNLLENFKFNIATEKVITIFKYFFNDVMISLIIFAISVIYIFCSEKNKKIKNLFVWYILVILIIIWNPIFIHIVEKFINFASLYRLYYTIPMYVVIAYAFTKLLQNFDKTWQKFIGVIGICFVFIIFGRNVFDDWELIQTQNLYKLPENTVFSAEVIYNDKKYENKKTLAPYGMSSQIGQIHSSINLVYTRFVTNAKTENGMPSPSDTDDPNNIADEKMKELINKYNEGDSKYIVDFCDEENVNYIIIPDTTTLQYPLENMGFESIGSNYGVTVYRRT